MQCHGQHEQPRSLPRHLRPFGDRFIGKLGCLKNRPGSGKGLDHFLKIGDNPPERLAICAILLRKGARAHPIVLASSFRVVADLVVVFHVAFVIFVMLGGLLALRWRWLMWLHVPAVVWGIAIEFGGWVCPLTPLEHYLRQHGGVTAYRGVFIEHYVLPLLYPARLTRGFQVFLGTLAFVANAFVYWSVLRKRFSTR